MNNKNVVEIQKDYNYLNYPHQMVPLEKSLNNVKLRVPKTTGGHPFF